MADFSFPPSRRLQKSAQFERVFARRRSQADGTLLVYGCENDAPHPRLGLVVSRKCGNAVVRNRWKRVIREAFRLEQRELPSGVDLVVLPRAGSEPTLPRVRRSLVTLATRLGHQLGARREGLPPEEGASP